MSIAIASGLSGPAVSNASGARTRRSAGPGQFYVLDGADPPAATPAASTDAAAAPAAVGLHSLLAMQEAEAGAVQDRAARRHAGSMLAEMSGLQRALLQGDGAVVSAALARLAGAARHVPAALDPRLAAVVRAIAMRAAVEAARNTLPQGRPASAGS